MHCIVMHHFKPISLTSLEAAAGGGSADAVAEDDSMDQWPFAKNLSLMLWMSLSVGRSSRNFRNPPCLWSR